MSTELPGEFNRDLQFYKFCAYGFLKNLRFFDPFLILFFRSRGLSFLQIGTLYAFREISVNLLEIPTGFIADGIGKRKSMLFSFFTYIISFIIFYFSKQFGFFIFAMLFFANGEAFRTGTHKAMIFQYLQIKGWEKSKVDYYGHTRAASQLGSALSALIAGAIVYFSPDIDRVFLFSLIPYGLDFVLMLSYPASLDGELKKAALSELGQRFKKIGGDFVRSLKSPQARRAILNMSAFDAYFKSAKDFLQPLLKQLALGMVIFGSLSKEKRSAVVIAIVYFTLYLLTSFASVNASAFSKRFTHKSRAMNLTLIAGITTGLLAGIFYHWSFYIPAVILFILLNITENLRKPINVGHIGESFPKNTLSTTFSVASQFQTLLSAVLVMLIGFISDRIGVGAGLGITALLLLPFLPLLWVKKHY